MKKIVFVLSLLMFIFAFSVDKETELPKIDYTKLAFGEDQTLEIVTWNIQNFPKAGDTTVQYVTDIILAIDADIFGLQEIESDSAFTQLVINLNLKDENDEWSGYRANSDEWNMNLAYIYKNNLLDNESFYEIFPEINDENNYAFPRRPLIMDFSYKNQDFTIINNHFKAKGGEKNIARRRNAVERIDEYIKVNKDTDNVIVLGDMNDQLTDPEKENPFGNFLNQEKEYRFADYSIAADTTSNWSYPYWKYRGHIDHILISNELFDEFETAEVKTIAIDHFMDGGDNARYKFIGDHRPVALKFKFE